MKYDEVSALFFFSIFLSEGLQYWVIEPVKHLIFISIINFLELIEICKIHKHGNKQTISIIQVSLINNNSFKQTKLKLSININFKKKRHLIMYLFLILTLIIALLNNANAI